MDTDIIIYAIFAVIIFARLWTVLGRRDANGEERPNPFAAPLPPPGAKAKIDDDDTLNPNAGPDLPPVFRPLRSAPTSLAGGLEQIKQADPSFDEKQFLQSARVSFTTILDAFAKGDLSPSARLLDPAVKQHFDAAIAARRAAGQVIENKLERIKDTEALKAQIVDKKATIVVRFVSDQQHVIRDAQGAIIAGEEGKIEEITDQWTFTRDTAASDPSWILVETKS